MSERRTLDASAILALIQDEPGAEKVAHAMDDGSELFISAVNLCEVISKLVRDGSSEVQVEIGLEPFVNYVTDFDSAQGYTRCVPIQTDSVTRLVVRRPGVSRLGADERHDRFDDGSSMEEAGNRCTDRSTALIERCIKLGIRCAGRF